MEMITVITISREYGSGGRDIGKLEAEKLDILNSYGKTKNKVYFRE